ncbi:MAG: hypothetical protein HXX11_11520 [Desulfuromonadales bacterium]|nr:hypothetical protein [Desulfuromonadales bacterium]
MKILPVIYVDGSYGSVPQQDLDELLEKNEISSFCRSSGWVHLGKDNLRSNRINGNGSWRDRKGKRLLLTCES